MQRLKTRSQFKSVLECPVVAKTKHFALHRKALSARKTEPNVEQAEEFLFLFREAGCWIGAMAPKKWAKRAVTRNAIKRQIYSVAAQAAEQQTTAAYVVRLRCAFDKKTFPSATSKALQQAVRAEIDTLLSVLEHPA